MELIREMEIERACTRLVALYADSADRRNGVFSYGIGLGHHHRGKGYGAEAVVLLLRFYFAELGYQKCDTWVYAFNEVSLALHRGFGFIEEGRLRRTVYTAGAHHDEVYLGLTAEEFFALNHR